MYLVYGVHRKYNISEFKDTELKIYMHMKLRLYLGKKGKCLTRADLKPTLLALGFYPLGSLGHKFQVEMCYVSNISRFTQYVTIHVKKIRFFIFKYW